MITSQELDQVSTALALAQAEMKPALKDANNPHFKSKYADLASVFEAIRAPLAKNNLAVLQDIGSADGAVTVKTRIIHKSGQWVEFGPFAIPADKQNAHGYGSAVTYVRRFALASAMGVSADDDDGNAASTHTAAPRATTEPDKVKNAPGISEAKTWVREHLRELNASENDTDFMDLVEAAKVRWIKVCGVYPNLWQGPEGSGLRGEGVRIATIYACRPAFDSFLKEVETMAKETQTQAAE